MSSSFQMWSATPAAIAARGDLGCQDVGSVKLTHYPAGIRASPRLTATPSGSTSYNGVRKATTGTSRGSFEPQRAGDGASPAATSPRTSSPSRRPNGLPLPAANPVDADGSARDSGGCVAAGEGAGLARARQAGWYRGAHASSLKGRGVSFVGVGRRGAGGATCRTSS
jgi:hypothetical protein